MTATLSVPGMMLCLGLLFCFFGYRLFTLTLTIAAFAAGFILAAGLSQLFISSPIVLIAIATACGIATAVFIRITYCAAVFLAGGGVGIALAATIHLALNMTPSILIMLPSFLVGGIITVLLERYAVIITTAILGATVVASTTIVTGLPLYLPFISPPYITLAIICAWLCLVVVSIYVQTHMSRDPRAPA